MDGLLIDISEVQRLTSLSRSLIYKLIKENDFPAPLRLSAGRVAWLLDSVCDWADAKKSPDGAKHAE